MTATFTQSAAHWAGLAARLLGWRPDEFWRATPTEMATALTDPAEPQATQPPNRDQIARMMERDTDG